MKKQVKVSCKNPNEKVLAKISILIGYFKKLCRFKGILRIHKIIFVLQLSTFHEKNLPFKV